MSRKQTPSVLKDAESLRAAVRDIGEHKTPHEFMLNSIKSLPSEPSNMLPSEWAEQNRFLTATASPFPGRFKWERSPFWREPLDRLSPFDPTQKIAIMKPTQIGFTCAVLENGIGYGMACEPMPMLFVSGDERLIARAKKTRIEPMIDSSGLREKIKPDSMKKGVRRTGDSQGMMEFAGGFLTLCGPNNESNFQGLSYRMLLLDEVDLYPYKLGKSGETTKVIEGRADAFKNRKKALYGSRPTVDFGISETEADEEDETIKEEDVEVGSRILELYERGDRRKYMVPCPHCGGKQELVFFPGVTESGVEYGLKFDSEACKDGDYSSVKYQCRHCGEKFEEFYKSQIVQPDAGAEWVPTAKAKEPYYVSYHINSLYSLTVEWWEIVKEFLASKSDPAKLQLFYNRFLGLPFEDRSGGVKLTMLDERKGGYTRNRLPPEKAGVKPLFLTAAADIQTGKNARIEVEIKAWGRDFRNWSIDYRIFRGDVKDIENKCWRELAAILDETWGPNKLQVERLFVDSSDGNMTSTVYDACRKYGQDTAALMIPIKGQPVTAKTRVGYMRKDLPNEMFPLIEIYTDNYKNKLAAWLRQDWRPGEAAPVGWAQFPNGYDKEYYRQLTTEERVKKRIGRQTVIMWVQHGRNESWDIFCYNTACAEFVIEDYSTQLLKLEKGVPEAVWDYFENNLS